MFISSNNREKRKEKIDYFFGQQYTYTTTLFAFVKQLHKERKQ